MDHTTIYLMSLSKSVAGETTICEVT